MSDYNREQADAIRMAREHLAALPVHRAERLRREVQPYLGFRAEVDRFQQEYLVDLCTEKCFSSRTSACCGREGILTFFADVVINVLLSSEENINRLLTTLDEDRGGFNCVYLAESGCRWRLKPIVCAMFLCDHAREMVLAPNDALSRRWEELRREELRYTRPTQPVLFDDVERYFLEVGCESPLMYLHRSPGLLRLKAKHGVGVQPGRVPATASGC